MKKGQVIVLACSFFLVLALVLSACGQEATPTTSSTSQVTNTGDQVYKVLNPQGIPCSVECMPCAPRIDSLAGKKIMFYISEAGSGQWMPYLLDVLKKDYPTATWLIEETMQFGYETPTEEHLTCDACIRGTAW